MLTNSCIYVLFNWEVNLGLFGRGKQCSTDLSRLFGRINKLEPMLSDIYNNDLEKKVNNEVIKFGDGKNCLIARLQ